jgi:cytoskeletal protein RodZ
MNDDYLWDKTGEPDPQVQQLEEILGSLRYQPTPLELPEDLPLPRRRNYFPWLAIAAAVLVALLAGGIWLGTRSRVQAPQRQAEVTPPSPVKEVTPSAPKTPELKSEPREELVAVHKHRPRPSAPVLSKQEREEALMAKEQVMLALRLTTEKLSLVHKKTQNTNPAVQIKNQHRVG